MDANYNKIGSFIGRLILGVYADKIVETSTKVSNIEKILDRFCNTVDDHSKEIACLKTANAFLQSKSPISLNALGSEVLRQAQIKEFIDDNAAQLINNLESKKPNTALDVQQLSIRLFAEFLKDSSNKLIKDFIYNNPKFQGSDLTIIDVEVIGGIYLRDLYLEKHKELL